MICANCQTPNRDGAQFCQSCGATLPAGCPNCGAPTRPGANFCDNCGHRLAPPPEVAPQAAEEAQAPLQRLIPEEYASKLEAVRSSRAMQGERRIVTILFCDLKGSTAAAEQLDPEEWTEIMNGAFEYMMAPVYQYEGTLARLMGDAILAFFGAPIAHEDDPQRAVLAALKIVEGIRPYREQIRRRWGVEFDVRVGINTGLVVVGEVGSDLRMEYTAMGDAANLAARMEQMAQPGTVQIAQDTYKLIAPLFEFEELGEIQVKGKSEPVSAYRVLRPKADPGPLRGIAGLESPLIGRDRELQALQDAVAALRRGRGQIVSVMGEAGLGKSRLVAELRKSAIADDSPRGEAERDRVSLIAHSPSPGDEAGSSERVIGDTPSAIRWLEGRSLSYQSSTPYAPFAVLLGHGFGLRAEHTEAEKYDRVKTRTAEVMPGRAAEIAPFIAALLGIQPAGEDAERVRYLEPPQLREGVFQAAHDYIEHLAAARPLMLVFDDVHWIDPTSLDLLQHLLPLTDRAPLMIVALFRPRRQEPAWRLHETAGRDYPHRYTALALQPLDSEQSRALVGHLLHIEDLPEKVRALILAKAEGNPFFVEEVIRSLLDARLVVRENSHWRAAREIEKIAVPDSLVGVITARLDRLDQTARRVAQTAAVIGREFHLAALADVADEPRPALEAALTDLQRRELIREKSRAPQRVYSFKHVLTQETAYASLLLKQRRDLHRRVAESLERLDGAHAPGDIARHFLEAQEHARALPYLLEAGERAAHAYSTPEAIGLFTRALEILQTVDDLPLARRAYEGLGGALAFANDIPRAVENYQAMLGLATARGDIPMQVSALNKLSYVVALRLGQFSEAEQPLADAERLAREHQDKAGLSELFLIRCMMCTAAADFEGVVHYMGESVELGRELNVKEQTAMGLDHIASTQVLMTQYDQAWQTAQEALQLTREIGNREHESALLATTIPLYHVRNGDLETARQTAEEGARLAAQIGASYPLVAGAWMLGEIARLRGEYERALADHQRSLQAALPLEPYMPFVTVQPLGALGATYLDISRQFADRIAEYHDHARQLLDNPAGMIGGGAAWADLGFCDLALGDVARADEAFQKGLNYPTMLMLVHKPRFLVGAAWVALARQRVDEAARYVEEARAYVDERAMQHFYPLVAFAAAQVSAARGETDQALEQFSRAEALALPMQMRPMVWQARAGAAQVLSAAGRAGEADAKRREARAMIEEIARLFQDDKLRAMFVEDALASLAAYGVPN